MTNAVRVANLGSTWTTSTRPSTSTAVVGVLGYNTETNSLEFWSGTTWVVAASGLDGSTEAKAAPSAAYLRNSM